MSSTASAASAGLRSRGDAGSRCPPEVPSPERPSPAAPPAGPAAPPPDAPVPPPAKVDWLDFIALPTRSFPPFRDSRLPGAAHHRAIHACGGGEVTSMDSVDASLFISMRTAMTCSFTDHIVAYHQSLLSLTASGTPLTRPGARAGDATGGTGRRSGETLSRQDFRPTNRPRSVIVWSK